MAEFGLNQPTILALCIPVVLAIASMFKERKLCEVASLWWKCWYALV